MANYCSQCGAQLPDTGKFCGACGTPIVEEVHTCPTCGQEWDGQVKSKAQPAAKSKKAAAVKEPEVVVKQSSAVIAYNTTAAVQPVYGPLYVDGKDCPNCGSSNMAKKTCTTCESEN